MANKVEHIKNNSKVCFIVLIGIVCMNVTPCYKNANLRIGTLIKINFDIKLSIMQNGFTESSFVVFSPNNNE